MNKPQERAASTCRCGKVHFEALATPIVTVTCYCSSCQKAGRQLELLASAPPVLDPDGGTEVVLYRKDRVQCMTGPEYLEEHRLMPESPTRRVVATCCNSAMFLDFTKGHWLSMYRGRFVADAPPLEMRVMTKYRPAGSVFADDVPSHRGVAVKLVLKMIAARIAMGLHGTDITWGRTGRKAGHAGP